MTCRQNYFTCEMSHASCLNTTCDGKDHMVDMVTVYRNGQAGLNTQLLWLIVRSCKYENVCSTTIINGFIKYFLTDKISLILFHFVFKYLCFKEDRTDVVSCDELAEI